jgi:hypothetical protein
MVDLRSGTKTISSGYRTAEQSPIDSSEDEEEATPTMEPQKLSKFVSDTIRIRFPTTPTILLKDRSNWDQFKAYLSYNISELEEELLVLPEYVLPGAKKVTAMQSMVDQKLWQDVVMGAIGTEMTKLKDFDLIFKLLETHFTTPLDDFYDFVDFQDLKFSNPTAFFTQLEAKASRANKPLNDKDTFMAYKTINSLELDDRNAVLIHFGTTAKAMTFQNVKDHVILHFTIKANNPSPTPKFNPSNTKPGNQSNSGHTNGNKNAAGSSSTGTKPQFELEPLIHAKWKDGLYNVKVPGQPNYYPKNAAAKLNTDPHLRTWLELNGLCTYCRKTADHTFDDCPAKANNNNKKK